MEQILIQLEWKGFNLDLRAVEAKMKSDYPSYVRNNAYSVLELYFSDEITQEEQDEIVAYWNGLTSESPEALSYQTKEEIEEERLAQAASAKSKLAGLGLTEDEIEALLG